MDDEEAKVKTGKTTLGEGREDEREFAWRGRGTGRQQPTKQEERRFMNPSCKGKLRHFVSGFIIHMSFSDRESERTRFLVQKEHDTYAFSLQRTIDIRELVGEGAMLVNELCEQRSELPVSYYCISSYSMKQ